MFSKLSLLALVAPLVSALTISVPSNVTSGGFFTIKWTSDSTDSSTFTTFSFELTSPAFNNAIAIANNVDPSLGQLTLQCPIVAAGGSYTIQAVDIGDINKVFAETPIFSIGATITSSGSPLSSTGSASVTGASSTQAGIVTSSLPATNSFSSSTAVTPTGTSPSTGTSGTGTAASTTPSSAAVSYSRLALTTVGGYTVLVLSAVAGAAAIAF